MIAAIIWTVIVTLGLIGSILNLRARTNNIRALVETGTNGPAQFAATYMRRAEINRFIQLGLLLVAGIMTLASPYYHAHWFEAIYDVLIRWLFLSFAFGISSNTWLSYLSGKKLEKMGVISEVEGEGSNED